MIKQFLRIAGFLGVQYLLGKRGSFPYGLLMKLNLLEISLLVILSDIIQTLTLINFLDILLEKLPFLRKLKEKRENRKKNNPTKKKPSLWEKLKQHGSWGLLAIAALPYGGGALTGSIVATSMGLEKKKATIIIITGCILGTALFYTFFTAALIASGGSAARTPY
jgi:uncharacterized membrane protein